MRTSPAAGIVAGVSILAMKVGDEFLQATGEDFKQITNDLTTDLGTIIINITSTDPAERNQSFPLVNKLGPKAMAGDVSTATQRF